MYKHIHAHKYTHTRTCAHMHTHTHSLVHALCLAYAREREREREGERVCVREKGQLNGGLQGDGQHYFVRHDPEDEIKWVCYHSCTDTSASTDCFT